MIFKTSKNLKVSTEELRNFSLILAGILLILAVLFLLKNKTLSIYLVAPAVASFLIGLIQPNLFRMPHRILTVFSTVTGTVFEYIVLSMIFFVIVTPLAVVARMLGKNFLDLKMEKDRSSYWQKEVWKN